MNNNPQLVLVTGEKRSGTTFFANLLNSQPGCSIYSDVFISFFSEAKELGIKDIHAKLSQQQQNVLISNLNAEGFNLNLDFNFLRDKKTWFQMFKGAVQHLASHNGTETVFVGIKKTFENDYLDAILDAGVKVFFIARDPRDMLLSGKNRFASQNLFPAALRIRACLDSLERLQNHPNLCLIQYETLILDKNKVKAQVENFLNCKMNFDLEELTMRKEVRFNNNSSFGDVKKLFDPSALGRWKKRQTEKEVVFANSYFKKDLESMNLELAQNVDQALEQKIMREFKQFNNKNRIRSWMRKFV